MTVSLKVKCKECENIQRCCAPPCEKCGSMNIEIIQIPVEE